MRAELIPRLEQPLKEIWPVESAPLLSYEVGFTSEDVVVRVRYKSEKPLDPTAEAMVARVLQQRLNVESLRLALEHEAPPKPKTRRSVRK